MDRMGWNGIDGFTPTRATQIAAFQPLLSATVNSIIVE
jgi:hypothetical protein